MRYCYTYFFRSKDETLKMLKNYNNEVENQLEKKIKVIIISDICGEYKELFGEFCF